MSRSDKTAATAPPTLRSGFLFWSQPNAGRRGLIGPVTLGSAKKKTKQQIQDGSARLKNKVSQKPEEFFSLSDLTYLFVT